MYVALEGPIGVGKTSLTHLLAAHLGARVNLEVVEENPFLAPFYASPETYAFQVQVFFLLSRFKQLSHLAQADLFSAHVVSDYLFDKDFIFAAMNLKDHEFALYEDLYAHLRPRLAAPDLTIYLRADPELLLARIAQRGRPFERDMQAAYLHNLSQRYDAYFRAYPGRLLTLEAADYDFVGRPQDRAGVLARIESALAAPVA